MPKYITSKETLILTALLLPIIFTVAYSISIAQTNEPNPLLGGQTSIYNTTPNAFGQPAPGLEREHELLFFVGNSFFNQNWVSAPASTTARDGLGPVYNARSCASCHFKDGRGQAPIDGGVGTGFLIRLNLPERDPITTAYLPDPNYGSQLQDIALQGLSPEGQIAIAYEEITGTYTDGTVYSLRAPSYNIIDLAYGDLDPDVMLSPRIANQIIGLGLLEAISEETILSFADPDDINGDGISGRPNYVWDVLAEGLVLGRFGWKANQPTLIQQNAAAFNGDIGITTHLFPIQNCPTIQVDCLNAVNGGIFEIDDDDLDKVTLYTSSLAVPAQRDFDNPEVIEGEAIFEEIGCASCHIMEIQTGEHPTIPTLSNQTIRPFTDLLLHDMGEGLADNAPDFEATGQEWRTPPLWGIGLFDTVNDHTFYLHDGRARNLEEAILWHGGEAQQARDNFTDLSADDRSALIAFLQSL
ncbi:MAG: di-heme oxidoredictase family protein [Phototrophicaceae bacterium]